MKNLMRFLGAILLLVTHVPFAAADVLSIHGDVPLVFTSSSSDYEATSVSGFKAGMSLFVVPVGIGYESYQVNFKSNKKTEAGSYLEPKMKYSIADVFINLPIPVVNLVLGVGAGSVNTEDYTITESADVKSTIKTKNGTITQFYASLGYEFIPLVDIHIGAHIVKGSPVKSSKTIDGGTKKVGEIDPSGSMFSIGVKLGF